jgi:hypothetical protein
MHNPDTVRASRREQFPLTIVTPAIGQTFIFFGSLFFMLLGRSRLRGVLVAFFDNREARLPEAHAQSADRLRVAGFLDPVVGPGRSVPGGTAADHGTGGRQPSVSERRPGAAGLARKQNAALALALTMGSG